MSKQFWILRDDYKGDGAFYHVYTEEPSLEDRDEDIRWMCPDFRMCPDDFEQVTGFKLKMGQFVQVELTQVSDVYYYED